MRRGWGRGGGEVLFSSPSSSSTRHLTYMKVSTKVIIKEYHNKIVSLFYFLKEATLSFHTDAVDIFCLLLKNTLTIVLKTTFWSPALWFSQGKLQNPIIYKRAS